MGKIILLNTPIGNLSDLTPRVLDALKNGALFAVEDTRVFKELLNHLGLSLADKRVFSLHDQSGEGHVQKLLEMAGNQTLYVASEAGSPIVSDPAFPLVVEAYKRGFEVDSFSGVSSPIMALELSALPPIPFQFHGFLPRETGKITKIFAGVGYGTHIFFEAPTRIEETIDELILVHPNAPVTIVRELSKKFQQVVRFKGQEWLETKKQVTFKGEFIFLFHRSDEAQVMGSEVKDLAHEIVANGAGPKLLAKLLSLILERPTKEIYSELNRQKRD